MNRVLPPHEPHKLERNEPFKRGVAAVIASTIVLGILLYGASMADATHIGGTAHQPPGVSETGFTTLMDQFSFTSTTESGFASQTGVTLTPGTYAVKAKSGCAGAFTLELGAAGILRDNGTAFIGSVVHNPSNGTSWVSTDSAYISAAGGHSVVINASDMTATWWFTLPNTVHGVYVGYLFSGCTAGNTRQYQQAYPGAGSCAASDGYVAPSTFGAIENACIVLASAAGPTDYPNPPLFGTDGAITGNVSNYAQALYGNADAYAPTLFFVGLLLVAAITGGIATVTNSPTAGGIGGVGAVVFVGVIDWWPTWLVVLACVLVAGFLVLLGKRGEA